MKTTLQREFGSHWRACALLLLCAEGGRAAAHDVPPSIAMLDLGRNSIKMELQLPLGDLGSALQLPLASAAGSVVPLYGGLIEQYIRSRMVIRDLQGAPYTLAIKSLALRKTKNANWLSNDWLVAEVSLQAPAPASNTVFTLEDSLIVHRVLSHQTLLYVRRDLRNARLGDVPLLIGVIGFGKTTLTVDGSAGGWWHGFAHLYWLGMRHIAEGSDHLLFLFVLLLAAPLSATRQRWTGIRRPRKSFRTVVGIVSGFTVGHSISLTAAATGLVTPPENLIEILVAVSILISSLQVWRPLFYGREMWLASAFGLVHGFAFAVVLSGLDFDGFTLALSLLGFNLGIESMQLLIIVAVLPLLLALSTTRGYPVIRCAGACFASVSAIGWIAQRGFGISNPVQFLVTPLESPPSWQIVMVCVGSAIALVFFAKAR